MLTVNGIDVPDITDALTVGGTEVPDMTNGRPREIGALMRTVLQAEQDWLGAVSGAGDASCTPWMPFSVPAFIALLAEALPEAEGPVYAEAGAGIGTKMVLAREIFGLEVTGVERVPEYAGFARSVLGVPVDEGDALDWDGYGKADLVWFNRVFRDGPVQAGLESLVWSSVRPGAVVMCANLEDRPPRDWYPVLDDWEVRRGIWQKPSPLPGS